MKQHLEFPHVLIDILSLLKLRNPKTHSLKLHIAKRRSKFVIYSLE